MEIKGHTIIFGTQDNDEEMGKFYSEVLGCTKDENGLYDLGGLKVGFDRHNQASVKAIEPYRCMITMTVDDINATVAELKAKSVKFIRDPEQEFWGGWFATFEDPDGNYLQLFQDGEPVNSN